MITALLRFMWHFYRRSDVALFDINLLRVTTKPWFLHTCSRGSWRCLDMAQIRCRDDSLEWNVQMPSKHPFSVLCDCDRCFKNLVLLSGIIGFSFAPPILCCLPKRLVIWASADTRLMTEIVTCLASSFTCVREEPTFTRFPSVKKPNLKSNCFSQNSDCLFFYRKCVPWRLPMRWATLLLLSWMYDESGQTFDYI